MYDCKILKDEGEFKIDFGRKKKFFEKFEKVLNFYNKYAIFLNTFEVLVSHIFSWLTFSIVWNIVKKQSSGYCFKKFESFSDALTLSIKIQSSLGCIERYVNPECSGVVLILSVQSFVSFFLNSLLIVYLVQTVTHLKKFRKNFDETIIDDCLLFHKLNKESCENSYKYTANVSERRKSITGERRASIVAYRRASIFGRRASKAEGHRFCRQKAIKSSKYEKVKTKKHLKNDSKNTNEVYKISIGLEINDEEIILLEIHAFLMIKKKVKTAITEFLEVLATRDIRLHREELSKFECEYCTGVGRPKQLVHTIDETSALWPFIKYIIMKKKWNTENMQQNQNSQKEEAPKAEIDYISLWPDESISVSKMFLEVIVILQYQSTHSSSLSETRKSFDLTDFRFHNPFN